jgi:hypothetical protein
VARIVIGKEDVAADLPSHVPGVHEGNWPSWRKRARRTRGHDPATSGAPRRSTGISASRHGTIDPEMPKLTPP